MAEQPTVPTVSHREQIKPAGGLATGTTRLASGISFVGGLCSTAAGLLLMAVGQRSNDVDAQKVGMVAGTTLVVFGGINTLIGMAGWKTARTASNARKFVKAEEDTQPALTAQQSENLAKLNTQVQEKEKAAGNGKSR